MSRRRTALAIGRHSSAYAGRWLRCYEGTLGGGACGGEEVDRGFGEGSGFGGVGHDAVPASAGEVEHVEGEVDVTDLGMVELLDPARATLHDVPGPQGRELRALESELADELREFAVIGMLGREEALGRDRE